MTRAPCLAMADPGRLLLPLAVLAAWCIPAWTVAAEPTSAPAAGRVVLGADSRWRTCLTLKSPVVLATSGEVKPIWDLKSGKPVAAYSRSEFPSPEWPKPDYDDIDWPRTYSPITSGTESRPAYGVTTPCNAAEVAGICARARFQVNDPAAVKDLNLEVEYAGGAVAYINGREIGRGSLPAGALTDQALAEAYPEDAYLRPDGKRVNEADPQEIKEFADRIGKRVRRLSLAVPGDALSKGVNVLAVEVRRAPVREALLTATFAKAPSRGAPGLWAHAGIMKVTLGGGGDAVVAGNGQPRPLLVWNHNPAINLFVGEYGDPCEPLRPVSLVGARGGAFSGQVVISSATPLRNLKAAVSELKAPAGTAIIPASAVRVRFARADMVGNEMGGTRLGRSPWFDGLEPAAPAEVAVSPATGTAMQPVWITVTIPRDGPAGAYSGRVTLTADGWQEAVAVPVQIKVHEWVIPEPKDFTGIAGMVQSPDSLALQYNVPMWSDRHWALIDKSFEFQGQAGNKTVYITLRAKTGFGNEHSMVRWIKNGNGWKHDFSLAEKYLDTAVKHLGPVPVVCLYAWDYDQGSRFFYAKEDTAAKTHSGAPVTELDPKTGALTEFYAPDAGTPEAAEFWKPVFDGLRQILAKRGLEKSMMVGHAGDHRPLAPVVKDFQKVAPDVKWVLCTHGAADQLHGQPVGYLSWVWGSPSPVRGKYGWQPAPLIYTTFPRAGCGGLGRVSSVHSLALYRAAVEGCMKSGLRGFGRIGADIWPLPGSRGRAYVDERYLGWGGLSISGTTTPYVLAPGADGPIATARFEMLREGLQEAEAAIFLEKAMADTAKKGALGQDLLTRCDQLLEGRFLSLTAMSEIAYGRSPMQSLWYAARIREQSGALYELASDVARRLAK